MKMTVAAGKNCRAFGSRLESDAKILYTRVCYHDMMMCVFIFHSMDECNIHISLSS